MKNAFFILLTFFIAGSCKKDDRVVTVEKIVGKWKLVAYEQDQADGRRGWVDAEEEYHNVIFWVREDGALLNGQGKRSCCPPAAYYLNGALLKTITPSEPESAPVCLAILCSPCEAVYLEQAGDIMIVKGCDSSGNRYKYVRQQLSRIKKVVVGQTTTFLISGAILVPKISIDFMISE